MLFPEKKFCFVNIFKLYTYNGLCFWYPIKEFLAKCKITKIFLQCFFSEFFCFVFYICSVFNFELIFVQGVRFRLRGFLLFFVFICFVCVCVCISLFCHHLFTTTSSIDLFFHLCQKSISHTCGSVSDLYSFP